MQRVYKTRYDLGQNPKRKGSISLSSFVGQLQNILFTYLCRCERVLRVVAVASFESARGVYYFLFLLYSKFYARRELFLNLWVKGIINTIENAKLNMKINLNKLRNVSSCDGISRV